MEILFLIRVSKAEHFIVENYIQNIAMNLVILIVERNILNRNYISCLGNTATLLYNCTNGFSPFPLFIYYPPLI